MSGRQEFKDRFNPQDEDYVLHVAQRVVNAFELYRRSIDLNVQDLRSRIIEAARNRRPKTYGQLHQIIREILDEHIRLEDAKK